MTEKHLTWGGKREINVSYSPTGPKRYKNDRNIHMEANVKRTFQPSDELYDAIFNTKTGILNDKDAQTKSLDEKTRWLHLWDAVCCESISPMEAYDCVNAGVVFENLTVRASNYMHLLV